MAGGRPSDYNDAIADLICSRIADGASLNAITKEDGYPAQGTVFCWLAKHPEFQEKYARARETQMDVMAEEILAIADDGMTDTVVTASGARPDNEWINRSRLRVDTRKWLMSKLAPKKYGDKVELSGPGGGAIPVSLEIDL